MFKIVSDQAKNVKKAFSSTPECVDIVEMTLKLLNRQRKIDLIAQQKAARVQNENILEEIAVEELEADIIENNTISPINLKERRTSLRRDQVLNIFEGDNDELTFSATNSNDQFKWSIQMKVRVRTNMLMVMGLLTLLRTSQRMKKLEMNVLSKPN